MTDHTIIAQVSRDDEPCSNVVIHEASYPSTKSNKPKRGFFASLFCCIGSNNQTASQTVPEQSPTPQSLLPTVNQSDVDKKCIVIDLDETLVHSSFKPVNNADFIVPVEIDGTTHQVYVLKRPYVDEFLQHMGQIYECVLFTASLAKYADPVADLLDRWGVFRSRLFRDSCVFHRGNYVKDLNKLGRELKKIIIIDNSPASYSFHPQNAVPVQSWFDDMNDTELRDLIPLMDKLAETNDIYSCIRNRSQYMSIPPTVNGGHSSGT